MKIDTIQGLQNSNKTAQKTEKPVSGADFKNLLEAQLQSVSSTAPSAPLGSAEAVQVAPAVRVESLAVMETTINSLESFGAALNNLSLPGETLEPFVQALEEETSSLLELKKQLPADDPLTKLLDRVAAVSYNEAAKYRRGDYQ